MYVRQYNGEYSQLGIICEISIKAVNHRESKFKN